MDEGGLSRAGNTVEEVASSERDTAVCVPLNAEEEGGASIKRTGKTEL